jgi:hypothetical protein
MPDPTQFDPNRIRVALNHGEVVELDGGTLVLDGEESSSVVLRLAPWRARSVARVLQEWSSVSRIFHQATRPQLDELDLSRTLELAAAALGEHDEPITRSPRGSRVIPNLQRPAAAAVLGEREAPSPHRAKVRMSRRERAGSGYPVATGYHFLGDPTIRAWSWSHPRARLAGGTCV